MASNQEWKPEFTFNGYTESELIECGDKFIEGCKRIWNTSDSEVWTEHVLDWFARTAPDGICVDARRPRAKASSIRNTAGEWLVDLVHTTYPSHNRKGYWDAAMKQAGDRSWSILLALESEWGKSKSHSYTLEMVLDDACKLTALRAAVKVLVTSTVSTTNRTRTSATKPAHDAVLEDAIISLRQRTRDTAPWLWVNLPNDDTPERCRYVMFGERNGTVRSASRQAVESTKRG